jgi:hypothetical protein
VVLSCDLDIEALRRTLGKKKVICKSGIVAVDGPVPVTMIRSSPGVAHQPTTPEELAAWLNDVLRLKRHNGVGSRHAGVLRLSQHVVKSLSSGRKKYIRPTELLGMARECLPGLFGKYEVDPKRLHAVKKLPTIEVRAEPEALRPKADLREDEALECLISGKPNRRIRGLRLIAEIDREDLFEWCMMHVEDESPAVRVAAFRLMRECDEGDIESIIPFTTCAEPRLRGAAIAAAARHAGDEAHCWVELGLKDTNAAVREEAAHALSLLNPGVHRTAFQLARYDPDRRIAEYARKLTAGMGYHELRPRCGPDKEERKRKREEEQRVEESLRHAREYVHSKQLE